MINTKNDKRIISARPVVTAELVKELNSELRQPEYKAILRESVKQGVEGSSVNCKEMIRVKDGWVSPSGAKAPIPLTPQSLSNINN